jgi:hypothetical protein
MICLFILGNYVRKSFDHFCIYVKLGKLIEFIEKLNKYSYLITIKINVKYLGCFFNDYTSSN